MSCKEQLKGVYVITDDKLTPDDCIYFQVKKALQGGAGIIQLRDKISDDKAIINKVNELQKLCKEYKALFVLNDKVELACELKCDGLHIGKSDHYRFDEIREKFDGVIGVSCYGDIELAKAFEQKGADYVAFGSFFSSPTKPNSDIVSLDTLSYAKEQLNIPVCAIGGINQNNIEEIMNHNPDMVSLISDIWKSEDITKKTQFYTDKF